MARLRGQNILARHGRSTTASLPTRPHFRPTFFAGLGASYLAIRWVSIVWNFNAQISPSRAFFFPSRDTQTHRTTLTYKDAIAKKKHDFLWVSTYSIVLSVLKRNISGHLSFAGGGYPMTWEGLTALFAGTMRQSSEQRCHKHINIHGKWCNVKANSQNQNYTSNAKPPSRSDMQGISRVASWAVAIWTYLCWPWCTVNELPCGHFSRRSVGAFSWHSVDPNFFVG